MQSTAFLFLCYTWILKVGGILQKYADYLDKKLYYMLLFTLTVTPFHQEFTSFCVAVCFFCALFVAKVKGWAHAPVLSHKQQTALYLFLLTIVISLPQSLNVMISCGNFLYVVVQYMALIFVALRYIWSPEEQARLDKPQASAVKWQEKFWQLPRPLQLLAALAVVALLESVIGIGQKFLGVMADNIWSDPDEFPELKIRVYATFVNPNIFGGYLVLVIGYCAAFFHLMKTHKLVRWGTLALGLLSSLALLYTYSRGNWIACAFMLLVFCICYCHKAIIPVMGLGAAGLLIGGQAVIHRLSSITSGEDTSAALRIAYLESTTAMIEEHPWGVGWYGYRFQYPDYNFYLDDKNVIMYHCHNIFLNIWSELGPQGIICFLIVWGLFLVMAWRLSRRGKTDWLRAVGCGYILASVGIAVGGLTDHVYFNTKMGIFFWFLAILTAAAARYNEGIGKSSS